MYNIRQIGSVLWNVILPLSISFVLFITGMLMFNYIGVGSLELSDRYNVFRDVLAITFAVTGILIAVLGLGAYNLLRLVLYRKIQSEIHDSYIRTTANNLTSLSYNQWDHYKNTGTEFMLEQAIETVKNAHQFVRGMDMKKRQNEEVESRILNNWGYFLAEKAKAIEEKTWEGTPLTEEDKVIANSFADRLESRLYRFPELAEEYAETIGFIRKHCTHDRT